MRFLPAERVEHRPMRYCFHSAAAARPSPRRNALNSILVPVIALVLWSFVMLFWLYAERIAAVKKQGIVYDPRRPVEEFHAQLPPKRGGRPTITIT